jgi:C-terminal processing protease CtpA/Prc
MKNKFYMTRLFYALLFVVLLGCNNAENPAKSGLEKEQEKPLVALGQLWGFLKYHHPSVAAGNYNWDEELVKRIPAVMNAQNEAEWKNILNEWVNGLPPVAESEKDVIPDSMIKVRPDYGELFNPEYLDTETVEKLKFILDNAQITDNHYIKYAKYRGRYKIDNEQAYADMLFPELPYRLLALFRFWNIVNYFFPHRELCDTKWADVLPEMLPDFVNAENPEQYMLACLKLHTKIDDTHGFFNYNDHVSSYWYGMFKVPFEARFIENQLVVTSFTGDLDRIQKEIQIGDVITKVNGEPVEKIVKRLLPYIPASNYAVKLRVIAQYLILKTNKPEAIRFTILRDSQTFEKRIPVYDLRRLKIPNYSSPKPDEKGYSIIHDSIGYIFPANCKAEERDSEVKRLMTTTKGLIIDLRCYPSDYNAGHIAPWLVKEPVEWVQHTYANIAHPGYFLFSEKYKYSNSDAGFYPYKVVVIVNEYTQSQSEDHVLWYQAAPGVTVIGSTTAAANGEVIGFNLPGGVNVSMTSLGVFYPDGTGMQRIGIQIDEIAEPTVAGIKAGRDEPLERALEIIQEKSKEQPLPVS